MLAVHFLGRGAVALDQVPTPEPRGTEVVVRVRSAAICGTDRENLMGPGQATIPGHESAGEVVAVDRATRARVGDRVAINCHVTCGACEHCLRGDLYFCDALQAIGFERDGGFAEYVLVPEACCTPIPADVSFEAASLMVDMLGTPFRTVRRAGLRRGDQVAIWGAGPIGLGALMSAVWMGVRVASVDMTDRRLAMAAELGAELTLNPGRDDVAGALRQWTGGQGIAVAFECVGNEKAAQQGLAALCKRGKLAIVGVSHRLELDPWELIRNELTIYASRNYNTAEFGDMVAMVQRGLPLTRAVTHRFALSDAERAFAVFRSGECGKVVFAT
jgi:threonine dehydrogenase-like Zn-dependent dehydrogenase